MENDNVELEKDEIKNLKKRKYRLEKAKDIMALVFGISVAVNVGSCVPDFSNHDSSVYYYSLGGQLASLTSMFYFDDEAKKCDDKIKKISAKIG